MLSRRVARGLLGQARVLQPTFCSTRLTPSLAVQIRRYADIIVKVPQMAESISEGTLAEWSKKVGEFVEQDEELASIETDKSNVAVNAPESGTVKELLVNEGDTVTVGQGIVRLESGGAPAGGEQKQPSPESQPAEQPKSESSAEPAPAKNDSPDTTPSPANQPSPDPARPEKKKEAPAEQPSKSSGREASGRAPTPGTREEHRVKMNRMRLRIAERLKQSQNTAASLTTFQEVDMSALMEFRKRYKDEVLKDTGVKLGFMSAFARATVLAMRDIPAINAFIEGPNGGDTIVYHDYVDISVAVATPKGLVTPVVRNVESMGMVAIERAIAELGKKARDNKLPLEDLAGGTFTISNGGVFGSLMGTPIINPPQSAILGLHAIKNRPAEVNGKIEIRPMMYLALTYDHRIIDGREAVTFLVKVKELIEDPAKMLLYD